MSRLAGRNDPCPCGSGRKFKRCCIDRERELERTAEAGAELLALGSLFPLLRPRGQEFERWLAEHHADELSLELVEAALGRLPADEVARIGSAHAEEFPEVWRGIVGDFGNEELARELVVLGAVAAAFAEPRDVDPWSLAVLGKEPELAGDPVDALAIALDPSALWSTAETMLAYEVLEWVPDRVWAEALTAQARRFWTAAHADRLDLLVERIRLLPPDADYPRASVALAAACEAYARDPAVRDTLATVLLEDAVLTDDRGLLAA